MNFEKFVTNAPRVLFALGWVLAAVTLVGSLSAASMMPGSNATLPVVLIAFGSSIWAVLAPWIAAALLWRIDRYLEASK